MLLCFCQFVPVGSGRDELCMLINAGQYTYTHTERKVVNSKTMELMRHLNQRDYQVREVERVEEGDRGRLGGREVKGKVYKRERERERERERNLASGHLLTHTHRHCRVRKTTLARPF